MIEQAVRIATPDGNSAGVLLQPESGTSRPGVLFVTDIGGIRETMMEMARRVAGEGCAVLMPNIFYRTGEPPVFDFPRKAGDERTMKRFAELSTPLTPEAVARDAGAYVDHLTRHCTGSVAAVGFCIGGGVALRVAAARPDKVAAVASFHGGGLCTDAPGSPHLLLPQVKARLYFGHADQDRNMTAEAIEKFNTALAAWGGKYESELYAGAAHGWTVPDSASYHRQQAERAYGKLAELLRETLGTRAA